MPVEYLHNCKCGIVAHGGLNFTVKNTKKLCLKSVSVSERSGASITQNLTELKSHTGKQMAELNS